MQPFRPLLSAVPPVDDARDVFIPVRGDKLLVRATTASVVLCSGWPKALRQRPEPAHFIGWLAERACRAVHFPVVGTGATSRQGPPGYAFRDVRSLHGLLREPEFAAAVTAIEVIHWDQTYRLCPTCGAALTYQADPFRKRCTLCAIAIEPRVQPSVVVLIHDGLQVLLARPHGLPDDLWSLPAAVVAPGESVETCLVNFLWRSLGLEIGDLTYHGSQPWPFPDRLMIGLHGSAKSTELRVDEKVFSAARFWHIDELPSLPSPLSLARRMADWYAQLPRVGGKPSLHRR